MENISFPRYLLFKDRTYSVLGYLGEENEYTDNKAYADRDTNKIYVCSKNDAPLHNDVPVVFIDSDNDIVEIKETTRCDTEEAFVLPNTRSFDLEQIVPDVSGEEELYDEDVLADMNAASSTFRPEINEDDDGLKKIVKQVIIDKNIDLSRLKNKMPKKYGLTNMRSALIGKTKMSIVNFNIWMELLGVNYEIIITDTGKDKINPLPKELHYTSTSCRVESTK